MRTEPSRYSQCHRILRVLEDGGWHSATEIFRNLPAGATIHSRVSELRTRWGKTIEHETRGPGARGSFYRLVLSEGESVRPGSYAGESAGSSPSESTGSRLLPTPESSSRSESQGQGVDGKSAPTPIPTEAGPDSSGPMPLFTEERP